MTRVSAALLAFSALAGAQLIGHARDEVHLSMPIQECKMVDGKPSCKFLNTSSVLDSNWRWLHKEGCSNSSKCNCYLGAVWVNATCSSVEQCTNICALDGEDALGYKEKYGISSTGQGAMNLTFVTKYKTTEGNGTNVGSRMYLLEDGSEDKYKMFKLLNKEFTFTVDNSKLPCGLNAAVYFVEMEEDGGVKSYPTNKAGAKYGTGYCDAQCPHDLKWIGGEANMINWNGSATDPNVGHGKYGTCCAELDIWEANKVSTQMTVHSCDKEGYYKCEGVACGDNNGNATDPGDRFKGVCDKNGCDFNPYREGAHNFYGPGPQYTIDSTKPVTVVTQFITTDGTDTGDLKEMRRFYIQDNKTIKNPMPSWAPSADESYTALSDDTCHKQMTNFTDRWDVFSAKGGVTGMGKAMGRSMSIVFSLWDDHEVGMKWLDAIDPYPVPAGKSGALRGRCNQTEGDWKNVEKYHPGASVVYSDVRYGDIGSTTGPGAPPPPPPCPGGSLSACLLTCAEGSPSDYPKCSANCYTKCLDYGKSKPYIAV